MTATLQQDPIVEIKPQPGPQEQFLSTSADIAIYGGAAGGGKTWAELVEPLRFLLPSERWEHGVKGFFGVIFRRTAPMIRNEGGLWDESQTLYPHFGAKPRETILEWVFPNGCTMRFASMQHEKDRLNWQGSQIPYIAFDELTHFTEEQFFYMLSRNRSMCGVKPYIRATTNPDADSWVAEFISWWIDQEEDSPTYGLPIPARAGVLRYFIRLDGVITWGDTKKELYSRLPKMPADVDISKLVKSVTFIPATIYDNKKLLDQNPEYLANLLSQSYVERERLLGGNWKVKPTAGKIFNSSWWNNKTLDAAPAEGIRWARYWDKAGTDEMEATGRTPYTVGVLIGKDRHNIYYIRDVKRERLSAMKRERLIKATAYEDEAILSRSVKIFVEQEPGSGGKESAEASTRNLSGFIIKTDRVTGDKISRALPMSAQVEAGNVYLIKGDWNKSYIQELHAFPDNEIKDQVDASSGGFNKLSRLHSYDLKDWPTSGR
jgi:predicted phage terminase large subunit-like protein